LAAAREHYVKNNGVILALPKMHPVGQTCLYEHSFQ